MASEPLPATLELQNRLFTPSRRQKPEAWIGALVVTAMLITTAVAFYYLIPSEKPDMDDVLRKTKDAFLANPWDVLLFILVFVTIPLQPLLAIRIRKFERLILTESEVRYRSAMPKVLERFSPGWVVSWNDVTRAYFRQNTRTISGPLGVELVLVTLRGERTIRPLQWIELGSVDHDTFPQILRKARSESGAGLRKLIFDSPVVRFVSRRTPPFRPEPDLGQLSTPFAFEDSRAALGTVILLLVLLVYAILDFMLNHEIYATTPPYGLFVTSGIIGAMVAWAVLNRAAVPLGETTAVALLFGCAFGAALYPGLLRMNQFTDVTGLQTFRYVLKADLSLVPEQTELPVLRFPDYLDYWMHLPPNSVHEFRLRRGALRFYQVDMDPVYARMRQYYRQQP